MTPGTDGTDAGFTLVTTAVTTFFVRSIGSNLDRLRINVDSTIGQSDKGASRNLTNDLSCVEA